MKALFQLRSATKTATPQARKSPPEKRNLPSAILERRSPARLLAGGAITSLALFACGGESKDTIGEASASAVAGRHMSMGEVLRVAHDAGLPCNALVKAGALAYRESQLYEASYNMNSDGSIDRGLWQINNAPDQGGHNDPDIVYVCGADTALFDAGCNARAMVVAYSRYGWRPWCASWVGARCENGNGYVNSQEAKYFEGASIAQQVLDSGEVPGCGTAPPPPPPPPPQQCTSHIEYGAAWAHPAGHPDSFDDVDGVVTQNENECIWNGDTANPQSYRTLYLPDGQTWSPHFLGATTCYVKITLSAGCY